MRTRHFCLFLCPLLLTLCVPGLSEATITATSCNYADVNAAINGPSPGPAADGDTVIIPAGTCLWPSVLTVSNLTITIQGSGSGTWPCPSGQTAYTCIQRTGPMIDWTTKSTGGTSTLKNMTFEALDPVTGCQFEVNHVVNIRGVGVVRVTGLVISMNRTAASGQNCAGLLISAGVTGVADHNTFDQPTTGASSILIAHGSWKGVGLWGDNSWATADTIGAAGAGDLFIVEDNTFNGNILQGDGTIGSGNTAFTDNRKGARWVARYNTVNGGKFDHHGTESDGRTRGPRHFEGYRNIFHKRSSTNGVGYVGFSLRGVGTARVFDNKDPVPAGTPLGNYQQLVQWNTFRSVYPNGSFSSFAVWGYCRRFTPVSIVGDGVTATVTTSSEHGVHSSGSVIRVTGASSTFNTSGVVATRISATSFSYPSTGVGTATGTIIIDGAFDGNTGSVGNLDSGYPCIDQVGRGQGVLLSGDTAATITPKGPINQELNPYYVLNNTINATVQAGVTALGNGMQSDRDYYNQVSGTFTGTTGIGRGPRSSRPTCTTAGTAYWHTDTTVNWNTSTTDADFNPSGVAGEDGGLDRCWYISGTSGPVQWQDDWYVPYAYPHPLAGGIVASKFKGVSGGHKISGGVKMQ